jgi:hypothetical protein
LEDLKAEAQLNRRLPSVQLPSVPFPDAIDFLRDITGANIYVDWKTVQLAGVDQQTHITVMEQNIVFKNALNEIFKSAGVNSLQAHVIGGVIVISTKLGFADRKNQMGPYLRELSKDAEVAPVLDKVLPRVQLPRVALSDAILFLTDITGADILVKWKKLQEEGIQQNTQVSLTVRDIRFSTVLDFLLDQAGNGKLGYVAEPIEVKYRDKLQNEKTRKTAMITISTIDDLLDSAKSPTTQPN